MNDAAMTSSRQRIYLDHNASAPLVPEARDAIISALSDTGNPSSVHAEGRRSRLLIEGARRDLAELVGGAPSGVVFTSGASEAATTCLSPVWIEQGREVQIERLAVLDTDHPCIRDGGRFVPSHVTRLRVDGQGRLLIEDLKSWLANRSGVRGLLALTLANSETGVVQDLAAIRDTIGDSPVLLVIDAVQMAGRMPLDVQALGADALIVSGHKIGAAKGVGAYVLRDEHRSPLPLLKGGAQERRQRAGTEAVALIAGFGAAARLAISRSFEDRRALRVRREALERGLLRADENVVILGLEAERLPNTVSFYSPDRSAETAQIALDLAGLAVSAGSACTSGKVGASHVLRAMEEGGLPIASEMGAIRISIGYETTDNDIEMFVAAFARHVEACTRKALRAA